MGIAPKVKPHEIKVFKFDFMRFFDWVLSQLLCMESDLFVVTLLAAAG
jgi:hypothetical protein